MEKISIKHAGELNFKPDGIEVEARSYADVSDGYHTIEELYDHRITLYIALARLIRRHPEVLGTEKWFDSCVWRSKLHHDGTGYDGWFMLGIGRSLGRQITYHIPLSRWAETDFAETFDKAPFPFDGHTSDDVLERLKKL